MKSLLPFFLLIYINCSAQPAASYSSDCQRMMNIALDSAARNDYATAIKKLAAVVARCPEMGDTVNKVLVNIYNGIKEKTIRAATAETERRNAQLQSNIAASSRLAAESESNLAAYPALLAESAAGAIRSMEMYPSVQGDRALRKVLSMLPPLEKSVTLNISPDKVAISNGLVAITDGGIMDFGDDICIIDSKTGKQQSKQNVPGWTREELCFSDNGKFLGVCSRGSDYRTFKIEVLNSADMSTVFSTKNPGYYGAMAFSANHEYMAIGTAGKPNEIKIHRLTAPNTDTFLIKSGSGLGIKISFSRDNRWLLVIADDGCYIWEDWATNQPRLVFSGPGRFEYTAVYGAFSPDNNCFALALYDSVRIYHLPDFHLEKSIYTADTRPVCFNADTSLVTFQQATGFTIWDIRRGRKLKTINTDRGRLLKDQLILSPDKKFAVVTIQDEAKVSDAATLLDLETGKEVARMFHEKYIMGLSFLGNGTAAITVGQDRKIKYWGNVFSKETRITTKLLITAFALTSDAKKIATAEKPFWGKDRFIDISNADNNQKTDRLIAPGEVVQLRFSKDNKNLLALTTAGIACWKSWDGTQRTYEYHPFFSKSQPVDLTSAFDREGNLAAVCSNKGKVFILTSPQWKVVKQITYRNPVNPRYVEADNVVVSPSGAYTALMLLNGIIVLDNRNGKQIAFIPQDYLVRQLTFTPDEKELIFISPVRPPQSYQNPFTAIVRINILKPALRSEAALPDTYIGAINFNRDGSLLAIAFGKLIRLYKLPGKNIRDMQLMAEINRVEPIDHCEFSADGHWLASSQSGMRLNINEVLYSPVLPADLIREIKERLGTDKK